MIQELLLQLPIFALGGGTIAIYLFKNPNRKFSMIIAVLLALWLLAIVAQRTVIENYYLPEIFICLAAVIYIFRFREYKIRKTIDWIKLILVILFAAFESANATLAVNLIGTGLVSPFVIDKSVYSTNLNNLWKNILLITFVLSIVSITFTGAVLREERSEFIDSATTENNKLISIRSELTSCKLDNMELENELKESLERLKK